MARVRRDERFWKECVQRWAASGLSAQEFASREGLRKERLFHWKRRLRESSAVAVAGVSFAKVEIQASRGKPTSDALEVVTRSGHTVRVGANFDESALRRLLTVLGGA
jgi:transposase